MFPTAETELTPQGAEPPWRGLKVAALVLAGAVVLFGLVLFAYELAVARVPQHRAALERLVRSQTGLDVRFDELGLRWGWYGPEAVFRRVELGEPGRAGGPERSTVLLRAPELVVGFDVWQTLRSGQLEAARITLIAADIDFARVTLGGVSAPSGLGAADGSDALDGPRGLPAARGSRAPVGTSRDDRTGTGAAAMADAVRILEGWQGGRVDLEGGTLRLPDPGGSANPLVLQIRRASVRRTTVSGVPSDVASPSAANLNAAGPRSSTSEWSGYGLVFLPERLGRTARVVMRLDGDLERPAELSGTVHFEGRRLVFGGWRDWLGVLPGAQRYWPQAGGGDLSLNLDFARGRVAKASGKISAAGLEFAERSLFSLDHVRGEWRLAQRDFGWRLQVESLELGDAAHRSAPASLSLDAAPSGAWIRGTLEQAPLQSLAALASWFAPQLDLSGVELGGTARNVSFDWNEARQVGQRLRSTAKLVEVSVASAGPGFRLTGLAGDVTGDETDLFADLETHSARLELTQAPQYPLNGVRVAARLRIDRDGDAWRIRAEKLELQHEAAHLTVDGTLSGDDSRGVPEINAHAELTGADVPLLQRLAGTGMTRAFGATFSQLTAGRIERALFELRGAFDATLPGDGFTGALLLRGATLAGGDVWPDAHDVDARIDWRGSRIHALIERGHAGAFALSPVKADWDASGERVTHISGHVEGPLEDAMAWMSSHPKLQEYAPRVQNVAMRGAASVDFNLTLPPGGGAAGAAAAANIQAHVTAKLVDAQLQAMAGIPAIEALHGTLVFDSGSLRRSTLTGSWLGGPVTLNVGERREHGALVLAIQGRGVLDARQLALLATAGTVIDETMAPSGSAEWSGELTYLPGSEWVPPRWHVKAESSLTGVVSHLPEPLTKVAAATVPLRVEVQGTAAAAELRLSLGDRLRGLLSLTRHDDATWQVERGNVRFGTTAAVLPAAPLVLVEGRVNRLDLPAYVAAWQQLRQEPGAPAIHADLVAGEMLVVGRGYPEVRVLAERTDTGAELRLQSPDITGTAHWPAVTNAAHPAELHFAKLNIPGGSAFGASAELIAALGPATVLSVDDIVWEGHSLGSASATIESGGNVVDVTDLHLTDSTQDVTGSMHCRSTACRLKFNLDSTNAAATLEDFGFRPELTAAKALLNGDLQWSVDSNRPALATLAGRLNMRVEDGMMRAEPERHAEGTPFALLLVPALVSGMSPGAGGEIAQGISEGVRQGSPGLGGSVSRDNGLRFARLEGDFDVDGGQASTSNLHFDGDAEILMRGRTGLLARDYDQQVWILRGEGRLPAAVRRLGPTPRVAAVWLSLRELFAGGGREEGSRAPLHLQGSWDDPIVVAVDRGNATSPE